MAQSRPKLVLVDGSSYLFRAFHALPPLTNADGEPTGAIYGVLNMLRRLLREQQPEHIAVVFDARGKTFRSRLYEDYKANRPGMPEELAAQIEPIHTLIEALGLPKLVVPDVEADDVIATLTAQARQGDWAVFISSGDKDLAQLVDEQVLLVDSMSNKTYDPEAVVEKFGVGPELIGDYLALVGDTSDNIPGIEKCGPKTAARWLDKYGDLDGVVAHADEVGGKIGERLREGLEQLKLSRELVELKRDVELDESPESLHLREPDTDALKELYARYEFKTWLAELDGNDDAPQADSDSAPSSTDAEPGDYELVTKRKQLEAWVKRVATAEITAVDTETDSLDPMRARLVGISLSAEAGAACYIPCGHDDDCAPEQLDLATIRELLGPWLADAKAAKVGQHIKYDINVLARHELPLAGVRDDTMMASYVLNPTQSRHDMDTLAREHLGYDCVSFESIAGKGAKQKTFNQIDVDTAGHYAAEDADITLRLQHKLIAALKQEQVLHKIYRELEVPLITVLADMERHGVLIDAEELGRQSEDLSARMEELQARAFELAGKEFNLGSTKQLQQILFEDMELPVIRKTPKGAPSTAEDVLTELAHDYELPACIIEHRGLSKLRSTYTDKLPGQINEDTGRVHTSYQQAVTATGRLSSNSPNLQNIPIRKAEGRRIRRAFVPPEGYKLLASDYSQIELRIMAHLSGDKTLSKALREEQDVHRVTAAEVFDVAMDKVSDDQRRAAKAINFGLIYGMSAWGLARQIDVGRQEAQEYIERYFERYPGVYDFMERTRQQARQHGYVETITGRRLYLPEINARNRGRAQAAERAAINAPMQGSAADIIKRAMIDVHQWLQREQPGAALIMQVHDELVFEVRQDCVESVQNKVDELMCGAAKMDVPLVVEHGVGMNWDEAH